MPDFNVRSDSVNVEAIMEQIRERIREKRGVDYTEEEIRELANVKLEKKDGKSAVGVDLSRSGTRSTFGEVRVFKAGVKDPVAIQRNVAVYTEVNSRHVSVPVDDKFKGSLEGPVTVQYVETYDEGAQKLAETQAVLR